MMAFRRTGRPTLSFQAQTRNGLHRQISTGVSNRRIAEEIEDMWRRLARDERAWDVLEPVLSGTVAIGILFDAYRESRGNLSALRRKLNDFNHNVLAQEYLAFYASLARRSDTVAHVRSALEWLFPPGGTTPASSITTAVLAERLALYPASNSTKRKVRSEWNGYFGWLVNVRELLDTNPMARVKAPARPTHPVAYYELDQVERIVGAQPTDERRALFALMYGTGIEVSTALELTREHVLPNRKEIRAPGTKAHTRDRTVRVSDWAWRIFWDFAQPRLYGKLFSAQSRHTVSHWHRDTVLSLGLPEVLPIKNARHHWAATRLRAGAAFQLVQRQLGHASPTLTLTTYGRFLPTSLDHDRLEEDLNRYEMQRRSAMGGAR